MRLGLLLALLVLPSSAWAQACTDVLPALVVGPTQMAAELPDKAAVAFYEVAVFHDGTPITGPAFARATIASSDWNDVGANCYTTSIPKELLSAMQGRYRGAIRPFGLDWSDLSNLFAYAQDPPPPPPTPISTASVDCTTSQAITDAAGHAWTLVNKETRRDGVWVGTGQGQSYFYAAGQVYVFGVNGFWYRWTKNAKGQEEWIAVGAMKPACAVGPPPPPPPPPIVVQVLKHFRITDSSGSYEGDLPRVP